MKLETQGEGCAASHPYPHGAEPGRRGPPATHHIFDLAVPIAEDDGIRGIAHRQHHCKGDAHGDWDQGVEWVNVQRFRLGEERIHKNINFEIGLAYPVHECALNMVWPWLTVTALAPSLLSRACSAHGNPSG
jgi:hypothetical protein